MTSDCRTLARDARRLARQVRRLARVLDGLGIAIEQPLSWMESARIGHAIDRAHGELTVLTVLLSTPLTSPWDAPDAPGLPG